MNKEKKTALEAVGWQVGSAEEFLRLSPEEIAEVENQLNNPVWEKCLESEVERKEVYTKLAEPEVKQHYLVKYESDWAGEIDIYGLDLLTNVDKVWFESLTPTYGKPFVHQVGTNEDIEYTSASRFQEAYTWIPITTEQREVLKELIGTDYGHFFYPQLDEDEDDTEEEEW